MRPITYWIQNEAIDQLVQKYGAQFERLTPAIRRAIIACLANDTYYWPGESEEIDEVWEIAEYLTRYEQDLLIEAIAASLTNQGNPQAEGAGQQVAIVESHVCQK